MFKFNSKGLKEVSVLYNQDIDSLIQYPNKLFITWVKPEYSANII